MGGGPGAAWLTLSSDWQPVYWLTLDPTPDDSESDSSPSTLLGQARQRWDEVLKAVLLAYNRDARNRAATALGGWLIDGGGWLYVTGTTVVCIGLLTWWRRAPTLRIVSGSSGLHTPACHGLAQAGYHWQTGQTAREFATAASAGLATLLATVAVADVPLRVVGFYYAERFGGRSPTAEQLQQIQSDLKRLELAVG